MGASGWHYFTDYEPDLRVVLDRLHRQAFGAGEYYWPDDDEDDSWEPVRPATLERLLADAAVASTGTHSVLDIVRVVAPGESDGFGTLRHLMPEEVHRLFGTAMPTREQFLHRLSTLGDFGQRWSGYCVVLDNGVGGMRQLAVWGYSGD
ncbi:hypothetical protein [Actinoplanes regularis]|uniref:Uncharacterized protein n=1 Tax=Actinoplanes regularis TaxID=52697 RepID=A0A238V1S0_9ACTN|nr:hypothetical protein [Actinoplanes regularis]GIE84073.1 hypothetical protein Are01nite_05530 [Actinoplanes regularis]SNR28178.1 hypothetical protein SAMN06264365_101515 [Actinoplanes regularis]